MFRNLSVRSKMMTIVVAVVVLFAVTMKVLGKVAQRHVVSSMTTELERSDKVVTEYFQSRYRQLDAGLNSLVDSPEIRAVLTTEGIDHDTQLMSITDLQHVLGADAILYCNETGRTLARTDDPFDNESMVDEIPIIASALKGTSCRGFWELDGKSLLAIAFPVSINEEVKGVVCAGLDVSSDASAIKSLLLRDVALARGGKVLTSSVDPDSTSLAIKGIESAMTPISSVSDIKALTELNLPSTEQSPAVASIVVPVAIHPTETETLNAAVMIPQESVFGFYHDFQRILMIVGLLTVGICVAITLKIASMISSQVTQTLRTLECVAAGDLSARLSIDSKDEFGRIAKSLNTAIAASSSTLDSLAVRNRDTKMLLDAVEQGFFTIDEQGVMSDERSGAVDRIFGAPKAGATLAEFIRQFDENTADWIEMGLSDVFLEIMPVEVTLDQLPKRFVANERSYAIEYTPVRMGDQLSKIAVTLSDITALVENEKLESAQREMMAMVHRLAEDRAGFLEFFDESNEIIELLKRESHDDLTVVKRRVHTLKGNASIYGLVRMASACHFIEDYIAENNEVPERRYWDDMYSTWDGVRENLQRIIGDQEQGIEIDEVAYDKLFEQVLAKTDHCDLAVQIASWKLEPTSIRLTRIGEQMRALAKRMGKGDIEVRCSDGDLRLDADHWSDFWAAFIHVIRNAVDHGLETPDERRQSGKSESGRVFLQTAIVAGKFQISVRDDGRGVDWEKITEAAYRRGLPAETQQDLVEAMFADGVSTATQVTETSGRGVGMAAIKEACDRLGGSIAVESEMGKGTTFRFAFPVDSMAPRTMTLLNERDVRQPERVTGMGISSVAEYVPA